MSKIKNYIRKQRTVIQVVPFSNENLFKHLFKIFQNKTKSYSFGLSVRIT